jgi:proteasome alpha subunit
MSFEGMSPNQNAYDSAITVYSPDGRLFQVEYAREAIKRGAMAFGVKYKNGVVLIAEKKTRNKLAETDITEKLFKIDDSIGCVVAGLIADGRVLVDHARLDAQINRITYNERIPVSVLVKKICEFMRMHTQYAGLRPFGVSLLIAGIDEDGIHLYETDPSGALIGYKAGGIGRGKTAVTEIFEDNYKEHMTRGQAILLGFEALEKIADRKFDASEIEISVIETGSGFQDVSKKDIQNYLNKLVKKRGETS